MESKTARTLEGLKIALNLNPTKALDTTTTTYGELAPGHVLYRNGGHSVVDNVKALPGGQVEVTTYIQYPNGDCDLVSASLDADWQARRLVVPVWDLPGAIRKLFT